MNRFIDPPSFSILIPTYGRHDVLINTLSALLSLPAPLADEIIVLDQTPCHPKACEDQLNKWHQSRQIEWLRIPRPSITTAMNLGLVRAKSDYVLFLDDDIIPDAQLLAAHRSAACRYPGAIIAGRVLQPWHQGQLDPEGSSFRFNSPNECEYHEFMGGNVSINRRKALEIGGFDRNFVRVAYRFEAEFAYRWCRAGHRIRYEPNALIHHLKVSDGGTRSFSNHLTTLRPDHAVGRYYYFWRTSSPWHALTRSLKSLFKSIYTRHHLRQPWWIPVTFVSELRGFLWACRLAFRGPAYQQAPPIRLLIVSSHPIQYQVPIFRQLAADPSLDLSVLYLTIPDALSQGHGFGLPFQWDIPLLNGYRWRTAKSLDGKGRFGQFQGLRLRHPSAELKGDHNRLPDVILITGWHYIGLLQLLFAACLKRIPIMLRMENNNHKKRGWHQNLVHRLIVNSCQFLLPVGRANSKYYQSLGIAPSRMLTSPYCVDNAHFSALAAQARSQRLAIRRNWKIPDDAFTFLFCGKLQEKKHPEDILKALEILKNRQQLAPIHLLIVGSGDLEKQLRSRASRLDLPVSFAGFLNQRELSSAYAASDALVLPSDAGETWGLVVNEAMACGLPAVVSDQVGCAEDLVQPGLTGVVYPCHNLDKLAEAMLSIASNPTTAQMMGANAAELVCNSYDISTASSAISQASSFIFCHSQN
ncbi:MAG: glycosyltransferase [Cyanobium sp.]|jgi:glycosyltransferase involved in cell wall biosynthesis